MLAYPNKYTR